METLSLKMGGFFIFAFVFLFQGSPSHKWSWANIVNTVSQNIITLHYKINEMLTIKQRK